MNINAHDQANVLQFVGLSKFTTCFYNLAHHVRTMFFKQLMNLARIQVVFAFAMTCLAQYWPNPLAPYIIGKLSFGQDESISKIAEDSEKSFS